MKNLTIGYVSGFMDGFSKAGLDTFEANVPKLKKLGETLGFDIIHYPKPVMSLNDARAIRLDMENRKVDFLLLFHPAYIIGDFVYELMKLDVPVGLWAIEEPRDEGPMPLASFVNLCQNAGIARIMFRDKPRKFKWFLGPMEEAFFMPRFEITVKALRAVKNLRDARVAQIGKLADGHINHTVDYRNIYSKLGVDVVRDYEIEDIIAAGEKVSDSDIKHELDMLDECCRKERIGEDKIKDAVKMFTVVKRLAGDNGFSAVAFSCWPKLMPLKGMSGCLINAMLNDIGIPAGCEGDVPGTVSMLILHLLTQQSTVLMDLPKFDTADNSLLLWHCGTSPFCMANERGVLLERHYFADYSDDPGLKDCGPITDVLFKDSEVTVFRLLGEADSFYYFTGRTFDEGKKTFSGSRGWVRDLKLYREPVKALDLMNTLINRSFAHHYPMVMADVSASLEELAYWLDLARIRKDEYRDFLSPDR
ncbi:MAG: hypothetical protein E4H36_14220 [Spirochaetales bacterium]|nr:MAG: hypothetical protein E4H36_14220 [Spirochaetales bacterium]